MLRSKKNRSIISTLQDRELNNNCAPYFLSVNVVSQILRSNSNNSLYEDYWKNTSTRPITYDSGYLYFSDYTQCCSIYGERGKIPPTFKFQKTKAEMKVSDVISYSVPVYREFEDLCKCKLKACTCLSQYLLTVSEDNWLCQHLMTDGKLIRQYYVNRLGRKFRFKYCDWDVYGDRFILTSILNPDHAEIKKPDVVVNLAVFTAFPFEFLALLEIKRSVFGQNCTAANISDQHLILGLGSSHVHIYSFEDFLKEGDLTPLQLGQKFGLEGRVGHYPVGLPLNFTYSGAPPLLFNVQCYGQIIRFGGYPYHYITAAPNNSSLFTVTNIHTNLPAVGGSLLSCSLNDDVDSLLFHPDHSNRLIFKMNHAVDCYRLSTGHDGTSKIDKLFSMGYFGRRRERRTTSSYGRTLCRRDLGDDCTIFCTDYASDLDLFAILGVYPDDGSTGFVDLYDSFTGQKVRSVQLTNEVCDSHFYQLYVDMGSIIVIERRNFSNFTVHVYNL